MEKVIKFKFEKATKNTFRFEEETEEDMPPIIRTLYVQKWIFSGRPPERITVILKTS